ncbi:MAG: hypothetical protein KDD56_00920 [Bdellovibrionales bacterium]|nr:hypothetical protein [Bdellovibrionales bacterium]
MKNSEEVLIIFQAFIQSLAHKIRTPLSIIYNELSTLEDSLQREVFELTTKQCKSIADILKEVSDLQFKNQNLQNLNLQNLLSEFFPVIVASVDNIKIIADPYLLKSTFKNLSQVFGKQSNVKLDANSNSFLVTIISENEISSKYPGTYSSLSEYFYNKCGVTNLSVAIADIGLLRIADKLILKADDTLKLEIILAKDVLSET